MLVESLLIKWLLFHLTIYKSVYVGLVLLALGTTRVQLDCTIYHVGLSSRVYYLEVRSNSIES